MRRPKLVVCPAHGADRPSVLHRPSSFSLSLFFFIIFAFSSFSVGRERQREREPWMFLFDPILPLFMVSSLF